MNSIGMDMIVINEYVTCHVRYIIQCQLLLCDHKQVKEVHHLMAVRGPQDCLTLLARLTLSRIHSASAIQFAEVEVSQIFNGVPTDPFVGGCTTHKSVVVHLLVNNKIMVN